MTQGTRRADAGEPASARRRPSPARRWAALRWLAVLAALTAVAIATLTPDGELLKPAHGAWCLVCGPHGGADVVRNVLLFAPLGFALRLAGLRVRAATLLALAASVLIEVAQATVVGGRAATVSDVAANSAGALAGALLAALLPALWQPSPVLARRLAAAGGAAFVAISAAGAWLVAPADVPPDTRPMWAPSGQTLVRPFEGHIVEATLNGQVAVRDGVARSGVVLASLRAPVVATATVTAMYPPGMLRPFVHAFAASGADVLVVGQRQRHLVFRLRHNGARLRLHNPQVELRNAFPLAAAIPPGSDPRRGPVVQVRGELRDGLVRLDAAREGDRRAWRVPLSPHLAWVFVTAPVRIDHRTVYASTIWLATLVAPLAYWTGLGWRRRAAAAVLAAGVVVVMLLVPRLAGFPPPAPWEWVGVAAGLVVGWLLARWRTGRRRDQLRLSDAGGTTAGRLVGANR